MEYIINYNSKNIENIESKTENIESITENIESITENTDSENEDIKPLKKATKKPLSQKKLQALERARKKATEKIKEKTRKFKEYELEKEMENNDIEYIQSKYEFYKEKLKDFNKQVDNNITKQYKIPETVKTLNEEDLLILKMLEKY